MSTSDDAVVSQTDGPADSPDHLPAGEDPGPGCLPGVMAATLIMGMMFFIGCGISAYVIFGKRTELATRTLEFTLIPQIQQSRLVPAEKKAVLEQLNKLVVDMKAGELENWQSSGVMQRLVRLPLAQWGEIRAVESFAEDQGGQLADDARLQLSRLRRSIEMDKITSFDLESILEPVKVPDPSVRLAVMVDPLPVDGVAEVIQRAKIAADSSGVPQKRFEDASIDTIVRRQIEAGITKGTY